MGNMNDKEKKYGQGQDRQTEGQKDNLNKDKKNEQGQKYGQEKPFQQNPQGTQERR